MSRPHGVTVEDVEDMEMDGISYDSLVAKEPVIDTTNLQAHPQQAALLKEIERKKRARQIPVPTDNARVIALLREYGEPITYFGEDPGARRDRLREVLSQRLEKGERIRTEVGEDDDDDEEGEYYTPGGGSLLDARKDIARFSLERARKRLARQQVEAQLLLPQIVRYRKTLSTRLRSFTPLLSELGGPRAVSSVKFSPVSKDDEDTADSQFLLSANWSGQLQMFELPDMTPVREFRGHSSFAGGISWVSTPPTETSDTINFISGGGDGEILLWNINNGTSPLHSLQPHTQRVFKTDIHPSEKYFAATSFDTTWSLSSFETQQTILQQDGHSANLMACAFHPDGSLIVTGGRDAVGRIWDLRTGRTIMVLEGHGGDVLCGKWSPTSGYECLTGSGDGTLRVWDLRKVKIRTTVPAHTNGVADIAYYNPPHDTPATDVTGKPQPQQRGSWLATAGFDGKVRVWSADDFILQTDLSGHQGKVISCDVSPRGRSIASGGWDHSVRLYGSEEWMEHIKEEQVEVKMEVDPQ